MAAEKKIPQRKCTGCGEIKDKKELIRIIRTPEDEVELDLTGRKNGRGAYLCNSIDCLAKARKKKGLERSLKMSIPAEVYDRIEASLSSE